MPRIRLKGLTKRFADSDKRDLQRRLGGGVDAIYQGYVVWRKSLVNALDDMIGEILDELFTRAEAEGERLKASEHSGYFPYIYRYQDKQWSLVKRQELERFLSRYLAGDKILRLLSLAERRNNALLLWGHIHRFLQDVGVLEEE